jgi:hypothetical protein
MEKPDPNKKPGFMIDEYMVVFPDIENLISTNEDGSMSVLVDVYKVSEDNKTRERVEHGSLPPDIEEKIQTHITNMFENALQEEREKNGEDKGS